MNTQRTIASWSGTINQILTWATRIVGISMLIYELLGDHLANVTALVTGASLAGASEVLGYAASAREAAIREHDRVRSEAYAELQRQGHSGGGAPPKP